MYEREIDGALFRRMLVCGLRNLKANIETVNDLNVFPIPDGDTGDNMYATLYGGYKNIPENCGAALGEASKAVGAGVLLGARGNSGVILSQMISGITDEFSLYESADTALISKAFSRGVEKAYCSVSSPVEGTMLTVLREASAYAAENTPDGSEVEKYFVNFLREGKKSLERTPEQLPVLKEAGVIDSGGAGVLYIMDGFLKALRGETDDAVDELAATSADIDFSLFGEDGVMQYGYCTEFLLQLTRSKIDIGAFSLENFKSRISGFGDSIVAVKTGSIVKIHIHTMTPGAVLSFAQEYGEFLTLKIENMTLQHNGTAEKKRKNTFRKNPVRSEFAVVAVADGKGIIDAFKELGADLVIDGGQGDNPSVETFLSAFEAVNSDNIFVLPNNSNVIMAANEAARIYEKSAVKVIRSRNLGEGYSALAALDYSSGDSEKIAAAMQSDINDSVCACVSRSVRDINSERLSVREGNYIGFVDKEVLVYDADKVTAAKLLTEKLGTDEKSFLIVFYGAGVTEAERAVYEKFVKTTLRDVEFYGMDGGQGIYDFIIVLQ